MGSFLRQIQPHTAPRVQTGTHDRLQASPRRLRVAQLDSSLVLMLAPYHVVVVTYFFGGKRTPGPPPFSSMNSTPAAPVLIDAFARGPSAHQLSIKWSKVIQIFCYLRYFVIHLKPAPRCVQVSAPSGDVAADDIIADFSLASGSDHFFRRVTKICDKLLILLIIFIVWQTPMNGFGRGSGASAQTPLASSTRPGRYAVDTWIAMTSI